MLVTKQPVLRHFWYPVIPLSHLSQEQAQPFQLLGQTIALWLDGHGRPVAVRDRCCHRSAQLSKGAIVHGNIRCPYHGWSYDGDGNCVNVPQLTDQTLIPKTYRVDAYPCQERYGYVWVALEAPLQPIPDIPEATDPAFRQIPEFYEVWKTSGLRIMENAFDSAHANFVHAQSWGDIDNPVPPPIDEITETEQGFVMKHWVEVLNPDIQKKNLNLDADKTIRTNERTWYMPFARTLKIYYPNGRIHLIFTAAAPIDDQTSQIVQFCLRNDTEADAIAVDVIAFDRQVTHEDCAVIETTDYDAPLNIQEEQHAIFDKPGIIIRRRFAALLKAHGEVEQRRSNL
jgi:phenylpropionate dioxygenase-like ring-hydroxylating dioxygenase large terminal subunit